MVTIVANVIVRRGWRGQRVRRFTANVNLPEFPRVGERVWLYVYGFPSDLPRVARPFRVVRRHEAAEENDFVEYDLRPGYSFFDWFRKSGPSMSLEALYEDLLCWDDSHWSEFHYSKNGEKVLCKSGIPSPVVG